MAPKTFKEKAKDIFSKIIATIITLVVGFIPVWLIVGARFLLAPEGFWQNLVVYGVGLYFLGAIQLVLVIIMGFVLWGVWE